MTDLPGFMEAMSSARTYPEMLAALSRALAVTSDQLFVVDHDFNEIRFLEDDRLVPLDGQLGRALRESEPKTTDDGWWLPIAEGDLVVLGVLCPEEPSVERIAELRRTADHLGLCTPSLRARFEDVERRRRRRDMSVAAELQWGLLPNRADSVGGFSFASVIEPAYDVAGDLFDCAWSDEALWVYSLDAMGHGLEATLSGVVALTAIRNGRREGAGIVEQINHANSAVYDQWHGDRFVTAVACRLDRDGIDIVNAGHEPLRRRTGQKVERLQIPTSIPLGIDVTTTYEPHTAPALSSEESLILLSDGSPETLDADGQTFGAPAVDAALSAMWTLSPRQLAHDYLRHVIDFAGDHPIRDDITIVVVSTDDVVAT